MDSDTESDNEGPSQRTSARAAVPRLPLEAGAKATPERGARQTPTAAAAVGGGGSAAAPQQGTGTPKFRVFRSFPAEVLEALAKQ